MYKMIRNPFNAALLLIFAWGLYKYYDKKKDLKKLECGVYLRYNEKCDICYEKFKQNMNNVNAN